MDGYVSFSGPYEDILGYDQANITFRDNRALTGGAVAFLRNAQVDDLVLVPLEAYNAVHC